MSTRQILTETGLHKGRYRLPVARIPNRVGNKDHLRPANLDAMYSYLIANLRRHADLVTDTMLREEPPARSLGLRLEIYGFFRETRWEEFESIQGTITGFGLSVLAQFDLRASQEPSDSTPLALSQLNR